MRSTAVLQQAYRLHGAQRSLPCAGVRTDQDAEFTMAAGGGMCVHEGSTTQFLPQRVPDVCLAHYV